MWNWPLLQNDTMKFKVAFHKNYSKVRLILDFEGSLIEGSRSTTFCQVVTMNDNC